MKKIIITALSLSLVLCMVFSGATGVLADEAPKSDITINVFNWGQYISDGTDDAIDVNKAFTEATGIKVNYVTFDSNESLYTKLKAGGSSYDVIIPSDYMIGRLIAENMLLPLNFDNIPNYKLIDEAHKNKEYDPDNKYSVPYAWGTTGIIYNSKFVDEADIGSWDLLWNSKYKGKILMFDNPRDAFGVAEFLLGYDLNTTDASQLKAAADKLSEQKPLLQGYVMDQIYSQMQHEEAWIAPYYAGDYLVMKEKNENLKFYHPKEGTNLYVDAMCIPVGSTHKEAAEAYINFVSSPKISAENLSYLGLSAPSSETKKLMDPETAENPLAYPPEDVLKNSQTFLYLPGEATRNMDTLWLGVKTGDAGNSSGNTLLIVSLIIVAVLIAGAIAYSSIKKKNRKARRGGKA